MLGSILRPSNSRWLWLGQTFKPLSYLHRSFGLWR